jgi:transcriptional regulator with XRE-family HTH domain
VVGRAPLSRGTITPCGFHLKVGFCYSVSGAKQADEEADVAIGDRVRELRKQQGLTQEDLARAANLTSKAVGELDRGEINDPHVSTLIRVAEALGVTVSDLIGEDRPVAMGEVRRRRRIAREMAEAQRTVELMARERYGLDDREAYVLAQYVRYEQQEEPEAFQAIIRPAPQESQDPVDTEKIHEVLRDMIAQDLLNPEQVRAAALQLAAEAS